MERHRSEEAGVLEYASGKTCYRTEGNDGGSGSVGVDRTLAKFARVAVSAQIVLRLADGETNSAVARRYRVSRPTVSMWRTRYAQHGLAGLHNEMKPGRPRSTSEEQIAALVNTALQSNCI